MINCDRCHEDVDGYVNTPGSTMSAGYYVGWSKFMDAGENIICDSCMWSDPRYIMDSTSDLTRCTVRPRSLLRRHDECS
jgi:hypothetical protein